MNHGNAHLCSFRASTEAEALELLPELAEALTRKSVERYPGEQNDTRLVQGALEALISKQATITSYAGRTEIEPNRIKQVDMRDLLLYNGLDALLTWRLFRKQEEDLR